MPDKAQDSQTEKNFSTIVLFTRVMDDKSCPSSYIIGCLTMSNYNTSAFRVFNLKHSLSLMSACCHRHTLAPHWEPVRKDASAKKKREKKKHYKDTGSQKGKKSVHHISN